MDNEDRPVLFGCVFAAGALCALFLSECAHADTVIGIDTVSHHWSDKSYNNVNPGLYVRLDNGVTFGAYRNSVDRPTLFLAQSWSTEYHGWEASVAVGLATGYQKRRTWTDDAVCLDGSLSGNGRRCYVDRGSSRGALAPLVAPSIATPWTGGWRVRLTGLPPLGSIGAVVHLSLETTWAP